MREPGIRGSRRATRAEDLRERLRSAGLRVVGIEQLERIARENSAKPKAPSAPERIAAVVEYRDGTVIDVVRAVE
jgi:citrate lyase subunit alpha / citrate CoA-transferase